jgi:hypothetical protein
MGGGGGGISRRPWHGAEPARLDSGADGANEARRGACGVVEVGAARQVPASDRRWPGRQGPTRRRSGKGRLGLSALLWLTWCLTYILCALTHILVDGIKI